MQKLKLNIGCGLTVLSGWVNIDNSLSAWLAKRLWLRRIFAIFYAIPNTPWPKNIYFYDIRKGLPFPDNSTEIIYSSHLLEHLYKQEALFFMKECYRVLVYGGVIRIIVPDLAKYAEQYIKRIREENKEILIKEIPSERFLEGLNIFEERLKIKNLFLKFYKNLKSDKNIHKWMYDEYSLTALLRENSFGNIRSKRCYESLIKDIEKLEDHTRLGNAVCLEAQKL